MCWDVSQAKPVVQESPNAQDLDEWLDVDGQRDSTGNHSVPFKVPNTGRGLSVSLRDVTFGYTPEHTILSNLNLDVPAGQSVALVCGCLCISSLLVCRSSYSVLGVVNIAR